MTETTEAKPEQPALQLIDFPSLMASLNHYATPADRALDAAVAANIKDGGREAAVRATSHFDAILDWVKENPEEAARIVLASVYVRNGRFVVQVPAQVDAEPTPEAE